MYFLNLKIFYTPVVVVAVVVVEACVSQLTLVYWFTPTTFNVVFRPKRVEFV